MIQTLAAGCLMLSPAAGFLYRGFPLFVFLCIFGNFDHQGADATIDPSSSVHYAVI